MIKKDIITWKGETYEGDVIVENNDCKLIRVKDFYDVSKNVDINFIKDYFPDYDKNTHYYGPDLFIKYNNSIIDNNKEMNIRFENGDFNSWEDIEDDESTIKTKFIVENNGYEIYEILPTAYDYYVDKQILNEIIEKHFPDFKLDNDKNYFVYKDGEPLNV